MHWDVGMDSECIRLCVKFNVLCISCLSCFLILAHILCVTSPFLLYECGPEATIR